MIKKIDIVAPASSMPQEDFELCIKELTHYGVDFHYHKDILKPDLYFASSLKSQLEQFIDALESDSDVIWCLRGGYGSMRLIPHLSQMPIPKKEKILVGFSDITSLHLFFNQAWNWKTIHGPTISQFQKSVLKSSIDETFKILNDPQYTPEYSGLIPLNNAAKEKLVIEAPLTGGNMKILQSSLKTSCELDSNNKIIMMEDVAERGYAVDRMLEQMLQSGVLSENTAAIIFGDFTQSEEKNGKDFVPVALERFAQKLNIPVLKGLPSGHHHNQNRPLIFNQNATLDLKSLTLRY